MIVPLRLGTTLFRCIDAPLGNIRTPRGRQRRPLRPAMIHTSICWLPHYRLEQKKLDQMVHNPFSAFLVGGGYVHRVTMPSLCTTFRGLP